MKRRSFLKILAAASLPGAAFRLLAQAPALAARPYAAALPRTPFNAPEGSWTFAVLPDTQYYSSKYPEVFLRQAEWLVAHKDSHRIGFVTNEGDIVNNPTEKKQWERAQKAVRLLVEGGVPFSLLPGNHDLGTQKGGDTNGRETLINAYFQADDYRNSAKVGFFETGRMENSWHEFAAPAGPHLALALEFGPRDEVLAWANEIVAAHPRHRVLVATHAYLYTDNRRNAWAYDEAHNGRSNPRKYPLSKKGSVNDGQDMWEKFVSRHPNIICVLNGHVCGSGVGYLESSGTGGRAVHQMLANFQDNSPSQSGTVVPARGYGGGGFLRLLQFHPDGATVQVRTYSPWYDEWLGEAAHQFAVKLS